MTTDREAYLEVSVKTANNLKSIAESQALRDLSRLSLPEIDNVVNQVAQVVPAGNVPGVILNGLARLPGSRPPAKTVKRDINLLFKGVGQALDKAMYGAFFAGPAAVIWGYQNLLKLAGKDPDQAFPDGTWQFYVDYAMREDWARHANETHGFETDLQRHQIQLAESDRATAWVMAAVTCLHAYSDLLKNEWRERVYIDLLQTLTQDDPKAEFYAQLYDRWAKQRPYMRGQDVQSNENYPRYRKRKFDEFLAEAMRELPATLRQLWQEKIQEAAEERLPAYRQQMSILTFLEPGANDETHTPISLKKAHIAVIHQGRYYLIPACAPQSEQPADINTVRSQLATLMTYPANVRPASLISLATLRRSAWPELRKKMSEGLIKDLDVLRLAPIIINCDRRERRLPLAEIRQTERGVGDQPLTLFDTGESTVFDQSAIFFDSAWSAAFAEIMTNEALSWAIYLSALPPVQARQTRPHALALKIQAADESLIRKTASLPLEASVETDQINLKALQRLRRLFKRRNDLIELTVNDLLVLYRAIHAVKYKPSASLITELKALSQSQDTQPAALAALESITSLGRTKPAIVIPVDGSRRTPRDRVYPITFEVPLQELNLLALHQHCIDALDSYATGTGDRAAHYTNFDKIQRTYLTALAGFGTELSRAKDIATAGESASVGAIKLLAHMPASLQRMFDNIPDRIDILNDIIRGGEILANIGAVSPTSTLTRYLAAKDDHDKKVFVWGVATDATGVMRITLRDFRPHVQQLIRADQKELAIRLAQDYLDAYADGLNTYIRDLQRITETSRETRLTKLEQVNG